MDLPVLSLAMAMSICVSHELLYNPCFGCIMMWCLESIWLCAMESLSVILPWHPDYQCKAKSTPEAEDVGVLVETMIRNLFIWWEIFQEIILNLKFFNLIVQLCIWNHHFLNSALRLTLLEMLFWTKKYELFTFPLLCECSSIVGLRHQQ